MYNCRSYQRSYSDSVYTVPASQQTQQTYLQGEGLVPGPFRGAHTQDPAQLWSRQTSRQTNMQTIVLCQVNHSLKKCCERYTILPALNFKLASCLNNVLLPAHSSFTISSVN